METYTDEYLARTVVRIARSQEEGLFVVARADENLPLPSYESFSTGHTLEYIDSGVYTVSPHPGETQKILREVAAGVENNQLFITVDRQRVWLGIRWNKSYHPWSVISDINRIKLSSDLFLGVVCTSFVYDEADLDARPSELSLSNLSVKVPVLSAVWDLDHAALVAAVLVGTEQQSIKAIVATLQTNGRKSIAFNQDGRSIYLLGAARKYTSVSGNLTSANAVGRTLTLLHPAASRPSGEYFYVVAAPGQDIATLFAERLNIAITTPLRMEWKEYLLSAGKEAELVRELRAAGPSFSAALCVKASGWGDIISAGVSSAAIHL